MKAYKLFVLILILFLAGCGTLEVGVEETPIATQARPTETATLLSPTFAPTLPPTLSPTALPTEPTAPTPPPADTAVPVPAPTDTQVPPNVTPSPKMVQIYLIALEDGGQSGKKIGCNDSAVPVQAEIQPTQGVLKAALQALLAVKQQYYGQSGLYNSLYQSNLSVDTVTIENGKAVIHLSGTMQLGGECDNPRVQAQLEETARQFSTVTDTAIFINGRPLADVLSLK